MISGTRSRLAVFALSLVASLARAEVPAAITTSGEVETARISAFLATLAPAPTDAIPFVEQRMSALLTEPLEVRGELTLGRDGTIDKHVIAPVEERVVISAGSLTLEHGGKTRTINLAGDRRWRAFHAGITGLLNRDMQVLTRAFLVTLEETPETWTLRLEPRVAAGKKRVTVISAFGRGPKVLGLRMEQGVDEWQEMRFPGNGT